MKIKFRKIKRILESRAWTLEKFSERMGLESRQAASYRIKNAKTLRTIESIAKALGVNVKDII